MGVKDALSELLEGKQDQQARDAVAKYVNMIIAMSKKSGSMKLEDNKAFAKKMDSMTLNTTESMASMLSTVVNFMEKFLD